MHHYRNPGGAAARVARSVWRALGRVAAPLATLLAMTACSALPLPGRIAQPTPPVPLDLPSATQAKLRDFDLAVKSLREQYIDSRAIDEAWLAEAAAFRRRILEGAADETFAPDLERLLEKLNDPAIVLRAPTPDMAASSAATTTFSGIGVLVALPERGKDRLVVLAVYAGSPAERGGVRPHDSILAVDGRRITYEERQTVIGRIRGPTGTTVTLTLRSPNQPEREVTLRRAPITPTSRTVVERVPGTNIGYLAPAPGDAESMHIELARGLRALASDKTPDGVILDLRIVREDSFPILPMLSLFANGALGARHTRSGQQKIEVRGKQIAGSQDLSLVILIGDQTQGPAVSFAAMLQDLGRAKLVGAHTSPQTAEVTVLSLPETELQLAIPSAEYRGIKGRALHRTGLAPDEDTGLAWETFSADDDPQMKRAIALLKR